MTCGILLLYHFTTEIHMVNELNREFYYNFFSFSKRCEIPLSMPEIMLVMLALCLMLLVTYYAKNYAGIIYSSLTIKWPLLEH